MSKLHLLLLLLLCISWPASALRAQDDDVLTREDDERATTTEERERTLASLLTAASRFRNTGETLRAARVLNRAGRLQLKLSLPEDALTSYQKARSLLKRTPDTTTEVDTFNGLGAAYSHLSKCDEAQTVLQQAIDLSRNYVKGKAEALLTLSDCQRTYDQALAVRTAQDSLGLWQSINLKQGIARAYLVISDYQLSRNDLTEATQNCQAALTLWRELNDAEQEAEALINLGYIEYRKGAWQNVFVFLTQAQALLDEKSQPYMMGQINAGFADAFIESGLPEIGLIKYWQALEYYRQAQKPHAVITVIWGIGRTYYILGDYPEALENLRRALTDALAIKEKKLAALCNESLGQTFAAMNDRDTALRYFEVALDLYTKVANPMEAARVRALMGQVYQQQGNIERARKYYQNALETFRGLSDVVNESATLYALGSLELKQNKLDLAEDYLSQSIKITENMRRVSSSQDLTVAFSASVHERYERYIECLMRRHQEEPAQGFAVRALETSELARGRSLAELLRATETNLAPGLDPQLAEREKALRQSLRAKEDYRVRLLAKEYKKEELDALNEELARLESEYKQVTETIRARYPSYGQLTQPAGWNLQLIQEQVIADDQTVLLEYSLGAEKSYVWAITRNGIVSYELPAQAVITEAAQKFYKLLITPPSEKTENLLTQAAHELGEMVLSPVASELNRRRVIVVADDVLNYIPFQVLPAPPANQEPLVANYEIINAPSASILGELRREAERRQPTVKVLAAFGDPIFAPSYAQRKDTNSNELVTSTQTVKDERLHSTLRDIELNGDSFNPATVERLFFARRELDNLRNVASAGETFVATDYDATRERLQSTDLTKFAILHFATHGFLDTKRPENSGLILSTVNREGQAQDGYLGLQDIYNLHAPVELVVLSACSTALGQEVRGEGLIGLTRGFMYAGASSVVASLWKVEDDATAELMKRFYTNMLRQGMTPAAALRAAQNSIRQEPDKPEWRSPYYWASFTLQGEYRRSIKPAPAPGVTVLYWKIMTGAALLLLLLSCVFWWHRRRRLGAAQRADSYSTVKK
jgi:CHAT domain-containing protein/Tfp pilus assembly protein PilF